MVAQPRPDTVRALKRLERAARDAARALAQEREDAKDQLRETLHELGIEFVDRTGQGGPQR